MSDPQSLFVVIPATLAVGEPFAVKVKVLGAVRRLESRGQFCTPKPSLHGPFNLNVERQIQYVDNALPAWTGRLRVASEGALRGPAEIVFDGKRQGVFPGDTRPIATFGEFAWTEPGIHFLRLEDPDSGVEAWSNPARVTAATPARRLVWGDPHWQTFFSDGIRCPEELYAFARDEGFLDFGAISDHMEAVTDRQWDYFQAVTNDFNEPGRFATLQGQEWTHHDPRFGAPGHRNIYYRSAGGPPIRSTDPDCNTLDKLWRKLDGLDQPALAIPHHPANVMMGVDWEQGWNPKYETAVEIYSVWGSSEMPERDGNLRPIRHCNGERDGRHIRDALNRGYRLGFMGGGDVHDGRPGDARHADSYPPRGFTPYPQGLTGAWAPALTREAVFDAIRDRRVYAATRSRILLEVQAERAPDGIRLSLRAASEDGIRRVVSVRRSGERELVANNDGPRVLEQPFHLPPLAPGDYLYLRIETVHGEMAWSSPFWADLLSVSK